MRWILLAFAVTVVAACSSDPIPLGAVEGTTITVSLLGELGAGESDGFPDNVVGFDSREHDEFGITDPQRGEVVFFLDNNAGETFPLTTQYVTRVFPDPASDAAIEGGATVGLPAPSPPLVIGLGQVLANIQIPEDTLAQFTTRPPNDVFTLKAKKVIDGLDAGVLNFETTLRVIARPAVPIGPTPDTASWSNFFVGPAQWQQIYPNPKLIIRHTQIPPPAAGHLVVDVEADVDVRAVIEEQSYGRDSIVSWRDDGSGRVTIDYISLGSHIARLALVYEPGPAYARLADQGDIDGAFAVTEATFWDSDGEVLPIGASDLIVGPVR